MNLPFNLKAFYDDLTHKRVHRFENPALEIMAKGEIQGSASTAASVTHGHRERCQGTRVPLSGGTHQWDYFSSAFNLLASCLPFGPGVLVAKCP